MGQVLAVVNFKSLTRSRQWQALISVPAPVGYAHPAEPQCSYDPVEGLTLAPDTDPMAKIKLLEDEISQLKNRLFEQASMSRSSSSSPGHLRNSPGQKHAYFASGQSLDNGGLSSPHMMANTISLPQAAMEIASLLSTDSPETRLRSQSDSPEMSGMRGRSGPDVFMDLLFSGWNTDLPDPLVLNH